MEKLFALADYGPIGFMLLSILLTVKVVLDHVKDKEADKKHGTKVDGAISSQNKKIDQIMESQKSLELISADLHKWHVKEDSDGTKMWHRKPSDEKRVIDTLDKISFEINLVTKTLNKLSYDIESLKERVSEKNNLTKG